MAPSVPPISIRLFRTVHVAGCPLEGEAELNFRGLQEEDIHAVRIKLRGLARTCITRDKSDYVKHIPLFQGDALIWRRGDAYPPPGSDVLRFPFRFQLSPNLPPSFKFAGLSRKASILYAISAVGECSGAFKSDYRVRIPLAILPPDPAGVIIREKLNAMAVAGYKSEWRTERREAKMRRKLWGEYSTAQVHLSIPNIPAFPLHTPIPFCIEVRSISTPLTRAQADAFPQDKPAFPAVPSAYDQLSFKLKEVVQIEAQGYRDRPTVDVMVFARTPASAFEVDLPPREWVPLDRGGDDKHPLQVRPDTKGTWVQRATFRSSFRLDCPPSFATETIKCEQYYLSLKVPFPGIGNDVRLEVPIVITSGITAPILHEWSQEHGSTPPLRLPPEYWDGSSLEWMILKD